MCSLGVAHARFGLLDAAIDYSRSALAIAVEQSAPADEFSALNNLGNIYRILSNTDRAGELARQALTVAEHLGDRRLLTIAWNNITDGDLAESRFDDALEHAGNALTHVDATLDPNGRATALLNLAAAQAGTDDYEASLVNCGASLELHLQSGDPFRQAEALEQMGDLHVQIDDSATAAAYFTDAVELLVSLRHGHADRVRTKLVELAARP